MSPVKTKDTPKRKKHAQNDDPYMVDINFPEKSESTMKRTLSSGMCGGGGEIETLCMHQGLPRQRILDAIAAKLMNPSEVGRFEFVIEETILVPSPLVLFLPPTPAFLSSVSSSSPPLPFLKNPQSLSSTRYVYVAGEKPSQC